MRDQRPSFSCFDFAPACTRGDLSGSEIPRFYGSGASHQRSFYWQPVHAPLLDSDRILTALLSHCSYLECHYIGLFYNRLVILGSSSPT